MWVEGDEKPSVSLPVPWVFIFTLDQFTLLVLETETVVTEFSLVLLRYGRKCEGISCMAGWSIYKVELPGSQYVSSMASICSCRLFLVSTLSILLYGSKGWPAWNLWMCFLPSGFWLASANGKLWWITGREESEVQSIIAWASSCRGIISCIPWHVANFSQLSPVTVYRFW